MLVSHDRYFLDVTVKRIAELWNKRVHFYTGEYTRYEEQKTERRAQLEAAYKNQQDRIQQLEAFINRFRYQATKAKQVQSRIKELEKIERIEIPPEEKTIHFHFPQPKPSGRIVAEFKGVAKSYGEQAVFSGVDFIIERGDRIALVGVNGAGKSTLIKILAGAEPVTAGEYTLGHNAQPDYFAQDQYKELDPEARMIDDLAAVAPRATNTELRSMLGCFLFSEDDVFKQHRRALGRRAQPLRAGAHAHDAVEFPAARRAHQPPRHARQGRAAGSARRSSPARWSSSRTTAISSTSWPRASSRWREAGCTSSRATTRIIFGARRVAPAPQPSRQSRRQRHNRAARPVPAPRPKPAAAQPKRDSTGRLNPIKLRQMKERRRAIEDEVTRLEVEIADFEHAWPTSGAPRKLATSRNCWLPAVRTWKV